MSNNKAKITAILFPLLFVILTGASAPALAVDPVSGSGKVEAVIGGTVATSGAQPWIAALYYKSSSASAKVSDTRFCGGSLVDAGWVITAAHCVADTSASAFSVVIGRDNLDASGGETFDVSEIIVHPYWYEDSFYDVAMLRLKGNAKTQPVNRSTPAIDENLVGTLLDIRGWGYSNYKSSYNCRLTFIDAINDPQDYSCQTSIFQHGTLPVDLMKGEIRYASYSECSARFRDLQTSLGKTPPSQDPFDSVYTPEMFCGWDPADKQTTCFGDSGGPVTAVVNNTTVLVGIVQGGYVSGCGLSLQIGIFTKVSYNKYFIDEAMGRTQSLGFPALCPGEQSVAFAYQPQTGGKTRVTVLWAKDDKATAYRLFYASKDAPDKSIAKLEVPATNTQIAVVLDSGQRFNVAIQSVGAACDGPVSAVSEVTVP